MSDWDIPRKYLDQRKENERLRAENAKLRETLSDVMCWVDNWTPRFTEDHEWPETEEKAKTLLKEAGDE